MGGMPAWAMIAGAPYAADKLVVDPIKSVYGMYQGIRNDLNEQQDRAAGMELLQKFAADPNTPIDDKTLSRFSNPKAAEDAINHATGMAKGILARNAQPNVTDFQRTLRDPEFQTVEAQNHLADRASGWAGDGRNPVLNSELLKTADNARTYADLMSIGNTPEMARIATNPAKFANLDDMMKEKNRIIESSDKKANLSDFAKAQDVAGSFLLPDQSPSTRGKFQSADSIRADVASSLADFQLTPEQRNSINTMVDKGMSDKWIAKRTKTAKGEVLTQSNPYTGEVKDKVENTTIINAGGSDKEDKRDFRQWTTKLDGLKKSLSSIQKGIDPITGTVIPQENIKVAQSTILQQIRDTEAYIATEHPEKWKKYRQADAKGEPVPSHGGNAPASTPMYAKNPTTGQRIVSNDGGKSWSPAR